MKVHKIQADVSSRIDFIETLQNLEIPFPSSASLSINLIFFSVSSRKWLIPKIFGDNSKQQEDTFDFKNH